MVQAAVVVAANSQTKPNNMGVLTAAKVLPPRRVTYVFNATSSKSLRIPYAVAVDGAVLQKHAKQTSRVSGNGGKIAVTVQQGQRVTLYLNSDAHPDFRKAPVYGVTPGERDVVVTITEKSGKRTDSDTPVRKVDADAKKEAERKADTYTAVLTGDIWMKVSHKYTVAEVDARLPAGTSAAVKAAVKNIYSGLSSATLEITEPAAAGKTQRTLKVVFADSDNPKNNISSYALLTDGLPRVHPRGYAALFSAALENDIKSMNVSSCWRPMLGSIAHRAGLGLDVSVLGGATLNRQELRSAFLGKNASKKGDSNDADNVTDAEVKAFGEYEAAISATQAAKNELIALEAALAAAKKAGDVEAAHKATEQIEAAQKAVQQSASRQVEKREVWNRERDAGEPAHTRSFRASLLKCSCVKQLFDPWFMEDNAHDKAAPKPNMQQGASTSNERLHAHHLHITVDDPRIL